VDLTRVVVESTGVVHAGTWMEAKRKITFGGTTGISRTSPTPSQDTEEVVAFRRGQQCLCLRQHA
jgi:hypothetical protein